MVLFIEILLIGVGLSMDAFAVSICKGLGMTNVNRKQALTIGLYFGGFQALMPLIGWADICWASALRSTSQALTTG